MYNYSNGGSSLINSWDSKLQQPSLVPGPGSGVVGLGNAGDGGDVRPGHRTLLLINRSQQPNGCNIRKLKMSKPLLIVAKLKIPITRSRVHYQMRKKEVIKNLFLCCIYSECTVCLAHVTSHSPRNVTRHSRRSRLISSLPGPWSRHRRCGHQVSARVIRGPLSMRSGPVSARPEQRPRV